ncbi:hypothetical protein COOONC_18105 [Cooperia oncophora]
MKVPAESIRIPKIYYMKMFTEWNPVKGYIIMEYLDNLKAVHLFETVTPEEVKQILRHKAAMEASSLDTLAEERNEYTQPFKALFAALFEEKMLDQMLTVFSKFEGGKFAESGEHLKAIIPDLVDLDWVENMCQELGEYTPVFARHCIFTYVH